MYACMLACVCGCVSQTTMEAQPGEDPCGQMENCSIGSYHNCEGSIFKAQLVAFGV